MQHIVERFEKEVAYLIEKLKEELGLSHDADGGVVAADSGGGTTTPPTKPGGN